MPNRSLERYSAARYGVDNFLLFLIYGLMNSKIQLFRT